MYFLSNKKLILFKNLEESDSIMSLSSSIQRTIVNSVIFRGIGLHSGVPCVARVSEQSPNSGISFITRGVSIPATVDHVVSTDLSTTLASPNFPHLKISTVEHILAAISAAGIDNAQIEVNGLEIPILDGSSKLFLNAFLESGTKIQLSPIHTHMRYLLNINKPVHVASHQGEAWLLPKPPVGYKIKNGNIYPVKNKQNQKNTGLTLSAEIDFSDRGLPRSYVETSISSFSVDVSNARTFAFQTDIENMKANGLVLGGSLDNSVVFDSNGSPLNAEGLRFDNEWARHKLLDCVGDLSLIGKPLIGHYHGIKPDHALNIKLIRKLLSDTDNYTIVSA